MMPQKRAGTECLKIATETTIVATAIPGSDTSLCAEGRQYQPSFLFHEARRIIVAMNKKKLKNPPVCALWWWDAAYSYEENFPDALPLPQLTTGFIVTATDDYTNIATNVSFDEKDGTIWPIDGFVVPKKAITEFKRIGLLHDE